MWQQAMKFRFSSMTQKPKDNLRNGTLPCPKKARKSETMLIVFFGHHRVIHKEFVPHGETVNSNFYVQVLTRL